MMAYLDRRHSNFQAKSRGLICLRSVVVSGVLLAFLPTGKAMQINCENILNTRCFQADLHTTGITAAVVNHLSMLIQPSIP